ncbi:ABC transporter substrate-binding protein [Alteraurantiacibacter aquimixticola]|uniref:Iron ABC transporter substrate-binding protein n=1 Tax=Alteraurantiacibacter aquimixticola TaxID=2489173 RepID=A0A4T3F4G7_9SPHN|nr:ABC transporter substrate-binding protein [Alteraurantiacibacter aquimixticola]TIX50398.1 iron ABC transporter substrate-binding protein [Alteraurantiacibacter aquimixticola]
MTLIGCGEVPEGASTTDHPTIVSLNPCTDAILVDIAAPGQLLAISHYSQDPAATSMPLDQARQYRATGGTVEEVLALDPDVVVAGSFLAPATRSAFEAMGVRVETVGIASSVEESLGQVRAVAALAGEGAAGDELVGEIETAWDNAASEGASVPTLMWQQGGIVPGPDSLIAQLLEHSGFTLHSAARGLGQGAYLPLERVLADPPQLVLASGEERMLAHPVLREVEGLRYETFDPALIYCGGPSIIRTLDRLTEIREGK